MPCAAHPARAKVGRNQDSGRNRVCSVDPDRRGNMGSVCDHLRPTDLRRRLIEDHPLPGGLGGASVSSRVSMWRM